jgi:hypothetical protein
VTNTTVEIVVPDNVIGSVYGDNGSNLNRLRQVNHTRSFENLFQQYCHVGIVSTNNQFYM